MDETFKELAAMKPGTILKDGYENGLRYLIVRGPCALCAYIGIPEDHPLAGKSYDDIPLDVHGGLTFADKGDGKMRPAGMYWYGWDYGHSGDTSFYDLEPSMARFREKDETAWTVDDVQKEIWGATYEFSKLVRLAEGIVAQRYAECRLRQKSAERMVEGKESEDG